MVQRLGAPAVATEPPVPTGCRSICPLTGSDSRRGCLWRGN